MPRSTAIHPCQPPSSAVLAVRSVAFAEFIQAQGRGPDTIWRGTWAVRHAAAWYAHRRRGLPPFRRHGLAALIAKTASPSWSRDCLKSYREGLIWWLRFRGRYDESTPTCAWDPLLDQYVGFLQTHRGLAKTTAAGHRRVMRSFLLWQFGKAVPDWTRVTPQDIWRYAQASRRGRKPTSLNHDLRILRLFLKFLLLRGAPVAQLISAVPRFSNFGRTPQTQILTDAQRRRLLASFDRRSAGGARDYCLVLCMVDLGLRPGETVQLCLSDIDWEKRCLRVPAVKGASDRSLPLPPRIAAAFRDYVHRCRPPANTERVFIRDQKAGAVLPMETRHLQWAVSRAYRRCGFPQNWVGGYRLRHTFASRLHARGADLKQIADLLGHRQLQTTTLYAKVDLVGLRALALRWPM